MHEKPRYRVIKDTREKEGWDFRETPTCLGTEERALKTGDYSLEGFEELLCIERKATPSEVAANIIQPRFYKELERMIPFKYKYIVCEFSLFDVLRYPEGSKAPPGVIKK